MPPAIQVFHYVPELDAFLVTSEFKQVAETLGITEWHAAVWIGRLFTLDNDYGEHWFDNWEERDALTEQAAALGIDTTSLMVIVPERMANHKDGPCHSKALRKAFWTDVLKSLTISYETLFLYARESGELAQSMDVEERIAAILQREKNETNV